MKPKLPCDEFNYECSIINELEARYNISIPKVPNLIDASIGYVVKDRKITGLAICNHVLKNIINDRMYECLISKLKNLETLLLKNDRLSYDTFSFYSNPYPKFLNLIHLDLSSNREMEQFPHGFIPRIFSRFPRLKFLNLSNTGLRYSRFDFTKYFLFPNLKLLNLSNTPKLGNVIKYILNEHFPTILEPLEITPIEAYHKLMAGLMPQEECYNLLEHVLESSPSSYYRLETLDILAHDEFKFLPRVRTLVNELLVSETNSQVRAKVIELFSNTLLDIKNISWLLENEKTPRVMLKLTQYLENLYERKSNLLDLRKELVQRLERIYGVVYPEILFLLWLEIHSIKLLERAVIFKDKIELGYIRKVEGTICEVIDHEHPHQHYAIANKHIRILNIAGYQLRNLPNSFRNLTRLRLFNFKGNHFIKPPKYLHNHRKIKFLI